MEKIREFSLQKDELFEHSDDIWKVDNLDDYVDDRIHSRRFTAQDNWISDTTTVKETSEKEALEGNIIIIQSEAKKVWNDTSSNPYLHPTTAVSIYFVLYSEAENNTYIEAINFSVFPSLFVELWGDLVSISVI